MTAILSHLTEVLGRCSEIDFDKILHIFHASGPTELSPCSRSALCLSEDRPSFGLYEKMELQDLA